MKLTWRMWVLGIALILSVITIFNINSSVKLLVLILLTGSLFLFQSVQNSLACLKHYFTKFLTKV